MTAKLRLNRDERQESTHQRLLEAGRALFLLGF